MKKVISKKLRVLRIEKGFSQINIAEVAFVSESTYRRIESGEGNLDVELLQKILKHFQIKLSDFLVEVENEVENITM